jgi:hypothetical protein
MSVIENFPLDFWDQKKVNSLDVLGDVLNEIRQQTQIIIGYSELLMEADLPDEHQSNVKSILKKTRFIESILDAGREYYRKTVD